MYSHPDINYKPQHPMLQNYTQQEKGYSVEEEGVFDSIKAGLSTAAGAIAKGAKAVKEAGANMAGVSTAPKDKMTKKNAQRWYQYYVRARALAAGQIAQKDEEKVKRELKKKYAELKKATDGIISYDDSKKIGGYM